MTRTLAFAAAFAALALTATAVPVLAHVMLRSDQAKVGQAFTVVLLVPHGCAGKSTTSVRVRVPDGVLAVEPVEKAGWTATLVTGAYGRTYSLDGTPVGEGVTEITWSGGSLPDGGSDDFSFRSVIAAELSPGTVLPFPVVQGCEGGAVERWIERPAAGQSADDLKKPAPELELIAD